MPISRHASFNRPPISTRLWRYTDLSKFVDLLTSRLLWLSNAEVLAGDDPYEGLPGVVRFPHRIWRTIDDVPDMLRRQILAIYCRRTELTPQEAFKSWFMMEEERCLTTQFGRRQFYVNCWHAAEHESVAMWRIYASPGAGVAIVSNGGRIETALAPEPRQIHLGAVRYVDPTIVEIGTQNTFDTLMVKRSSYSYEQEVRLVHWDTEDHHDPLANFAWNEETMRFNDIIDDPRPLTPGISCQCDLDTLIERVIVSPFAPSWYLLMIERLREQLGFQFPVISSTLLTAPSTVP